MKKWMDRLDGQTGRWIEQEWDEKAVTSITALTVGPWIFGYLLCKLIPWELALDILACIVDSCLKSLPDFHLWKETFHCPRQGISSRTVLSVHRQHAIYRRNSANWIHTGHLLHVLVSDTEATNDFSMRPTHWGLLYKNSMVTRMLFLCVIK